MKKLVSLFCLFSFLFANSASAQLLNYLFTQSEDDEDIYRIETGDVLEIVILGEEDLSKTVMVMQDGMISFPLIGEFKLAGLTTESATKVITERLKKYFIQPVVSITLKSPTLPYVSVFGEVVDQGAIDYQRGLRVTDYIALAGGPTPSANLGHVKVVRFRTEESLVQTINVDDILKKGRSEENYELKSGDWIYVSKRFTFPWAVFVQTLTLAIAALNLYITIDRIE